MSNIYKFMLKMHVGQPSIPDVTVGQTIKRGECIASPKPDQLGAKIHSSVSGKVTEITDTAIVIEADATQSKDFKKIKKCSTIVETVKEAGIVGAGGAGFPTHVKLSTKIEGGHIIANCVECEPGLKHNVERLSTDTEVILDGIKYAMETTGATSAYIGIKAKHADTIKTVQQVLDKLKYDFITIHAVKDMYPMGEERALIHSIFDEWIDPKDLPSSLNCTVLNGETLYNITKAIQEQKPVIDKDMTIIGDFTNHDHSTVIYDVPVGKSISELTADYHSYYEIGEVIMGGPYTGVAIDPKNSYVTKTCGSIIFTIPLPIYEGPMGLLVCACGGNEARLRDIATKMKSDIKGVTFCKNYTENNKCKTPGTCPGQAQASLYLKSCGAKRIIISNCHDCSNTVMNSAPKMGMGVYHATDHILRTIEYPLVRRMSID